MSHEQNNTNNDIILLQTKMCAIYKDDGVSCINAFEMHHSSSI